MKFDTVQFEVFVTLEEASGEEQLPKVMVYLFNTKGRYLESALVENGQATFSLPAKVAGQGIRLFVGPDFEMPEPPSLSTLARFEAYEKRWKIDPQNPRVEIFIPKLVWELWILCKCLVRGRLVKQVTLPDGSVKQLPICHARVTICEVDPLSRIIAKLSPNLLIRLRDDLIKSFEKPIPSIPSPGPSPAVLSWPGFVPRWDLILINPQPEPPDPSAWGMASVFENIFGGPEAGTQERLRPLATINSTMELRSSLEGVADLIYPMICRWPWLDRFIQYQVDCFRTAEVDANGRFQTTIFYSCFGDKPDLYFKADQLQGGSWRTIFEPMVRCHIYWNYPCGKEVVINVTDPSAITCEPDITVDTDLTTWVMPYAVGGTYIWGNPPVVPSPAGEPEAPPEAPAGWVNSQGKTNYSGIVDAPFGGYLGFRLGYANDLPNNNIKYFRWSYRKGTSGAWFHMNIPVTRHYVHQVDDEFPTFPVYKLGPNTVGGNTDLFEFKPDVPPDPGLPGTQTFWPVDDFFADIYSAYLDTTVLSPNIAGAAGLYQIKLELFDPAGNLVTPDSGNFAFIVPSEVHADGLVIPRGAEPNEIDTGGFIFNLHIDNNPCKAVIDPPSIGLISVADECGFLRYDPSSQDQVSIRFLAQHPNNFATFNFDFYRGSEYLEAISASGEVNATSADPFTGDGVGNFNKNFGRDALMCGPKDPKKCCQNAAFSENLHVSAKVTNGWGRLGSVVGGYDAGAVRAFALAEQE
jgi:hypothetical protein